MKTRTFLGFASSLVLAGLAASACGDDTGTGGSGATTSSSTSQGGENTGGNPTSNGGNGGDTATTTSSTGGGPPIGEFDCSAPDAGAIPGLKLTPFVTVTGSPLLTTSSPNDTERVFVMTQEGAIYVVNNGTLNPTPFLDIGDLVQAGGEEGLLGMAFHPDYETNGRFFLHYTDNSSNTTIAEYERGDTADVANPTEVGILMNFDSEEGNHNGGSIEFGPDGFLYIFMGDGGGGGDPDGDALDINSLLGKVLRLDVDNPSGGNLYGIPAGNTVGGAPEVFHFGVRNPYRSSFDPCTGDMYMADVGQNAWEEINVTPETLPASNFGWNCWEATHPFAGGPDGCQADPNVQPVAEYDHGGGKCSVTGGNVYRSSAIPTLRGTYFYADVCTGDVWTFLWDGEAATNPVNRTADLESDGIPIVGFGQDQRGNVYVSSLAGSVFRIDAD